MSFTEEGLKQVLGRVYMRAKATEVSMPKQWEGKKEAGVDWWRGFCSRQKFRLPFPTLRCVACKINVKNSEIPAVSVTVLPVKTALISAKAGLCAKSALKVFCSKL